MLNKEQIRGIPPLEAFVVVMLILLEISLSIILLKVGPHIPIVFAIFFLFLYGLWKKVPIKEIEAGMIDGVKSGLGAVLIFFFIGMLISSWMVSGTIPTFIYFALEVMNGTYFYGIIFVVTAIVGISIGSSLTTAATIGVAFIGVSSALDLSLPITAGAIISGAFFGDKMSPLSDTTNLASMIVKVDLFEHIRNMGWTTIPAFIISFIIYMFLSPTKVQADLSHIEHLKETLLQLGLVHYYSIIPFLVLAILAMRKVSGLFTLIMGIMSALIVSVFVEGKIDLYGMMNLLFSGYVSNSGVEDIDALLSRGGIESMMFSISLVILALSLGGMLLRLGIIPAIIEGVGKFLRKTSQLITATALTAVGLNFLVGEQYLSILLTGNAYQHVYEKLKLHPKTLSRALEDGGTVINPLVPWSVCGIFLAEVLGVSTLTYVPFTFFCLLSPILTIFFGITGWTITRQE